MWSEQHELEKIAVIFFEYYTHLTLLELYFFVDKTTWRKSKWAPLKILRNDNMKAKSRKSNSARRVSETVSMKKFLIEHGEC